MTKRQKYSILQQVRRFREVYRDPLNANLGYLLEQVNNLPFVKSAQYSRLKEDMDLGQQKHGHVTIWMDDGWMIKSSPHPYHVGNMLDAILETCPKLDKRIRRRIANDLVP